MALLPSVPFLSRDEVLKWPPLGPMNLDPARVLALLDDRDAALIRESQLERSLEGHDANTVNLMKQLAESQARELKLREKLQAIDKGCDDAQEDPYCVGEITVRDLCREALATTPNTDALREFGVKVARRDRMDLPGEQDEGAVVDAVLREMK